MPDGFAVGAERDILIRVVRVAGEVMRGLLVGGCLFLVAGVSAAGCGDDSGDGATPFVSISAGEDTPAPSDDGDDGDQDATPNDNDADDRDGEGSEGVPDDFDACTLLTVEEIAEATGVTVDVGEPFGDPPFYDCQWTANGGGFDVSLFTGERDDVEFYFGIGHEADEEVDGVGDEAYWDDTLASLEVLTGNYSVTVGSGGTAVMTLEETIEVAEKVIDRLP